MSGTIHFVALTQIRKTILRFPDRKIGIEITICLLGPANQTDDIIHCFFQFCIRITHQPVGHRLQPLCQITVLKYHPIEITLLIACRYLKICKAVTRIPLVVSFRHAEIFDAVVGNGIFGRIR